MIFPRILIWNAILALSVEWRVQWLRPLTSMRLLCLIWLVFIIFYLIISKPLLPCLPFITKSTMRIRMTSKMLFMRICRAFLEVVLMLFIKCRASLFELISILLRGMSSLLKRSIQRKWLNLKRGHRMRSRPRWDNSICRTGSIRSMLPNS